MSTYFAAWTCSLGAGALDDYEPAISLATKACETSPDNDQFLNTLGAVLYRSGRTVEALQRLADVDRRLGQSTANANSSPAYTWYFLAMAHQKAGDAEQAQQYLQKANEDAERALGDQQNSPPWNRKLTLELLRKEAEGVLSDAKDAALAPPEPPQDQKPETDNSAPNKVPPEQPGTDP